MAEPSRPPPPKAYVPSKKPPARPGTNPVGTAETELPIPPRPAPEDLPSELRGTVASEGGDELQRSVKKGRGAAPPPPAPYVGRQTSANKLSSDEQSTIAAATAGGVDENDGSKGRAPPRTRPPPVRPSKGPSSGSTGPKVPISTQSSSSKKPNITIVSAQPMTSDVIPPPTLTTPTGDKSSTSSHPPMPTEPAPDLPPEAITPPAKPNRSPPTQRASEPSLPKRGPAPPKPARASPVLSRGGATQEEEEKSSSPKEPNRTSRGSLRKAPPPPTGRPRPPPPQSKSQVKETGDLISFETEEGGPEYALPIKRTNKKPSEAAGYTDPVSTNKTDGNSEYTGLLPSNEEQEEYTSPVSPVDNKPVNKPASRPPPPSSRPRPPPPQATPRTKPEEVKNEGTEKGLGEDKSTSPVYALVTDESTSQTSLEANEGAENTAPPVPSSPRPRNLQRQTSEEMRAAAAAKQSPPTKPSRPRPPPPARQNPDSVSKSLPPTQRPKPPTSRSVTKQEKQENEGVEDDDKSPPTQRPKPPPPRSATKQGNEGAEDDDKSPPIQRPKPPPPRSATKQEKQTNEGAEDDDKSPPTQRPKPRPPRSVTKQENEGTEDDDKSPPTQRPKPPPPRSATKQEKQENEVAVDNNKKTPPTQKRRPLPPKTKELNEEAENVDKSPPTERPKPPPTRTVKKEEEKEDDKRTPPTHKPRPPLPKTTEKETDQHKAPPTKPSKPPPRQKSTDSVTSSLPTQPRAPPRSAPPTETPKEDETKEKSPVLTKPRPPPPQSKPPTAPLQSVTASHEEQKENDVEETPVSSTPSRPGGGPSKPPPPRKSAGGPPSKPPPPTAAEAEAKTPPLRPAAGPPRGSSPARPGQGPKPKPPRPGEMPSSTSGGSISKSAPPKPGPPKPTARRSTLSKDREEGPPALPPRPEAGHPLYRYVCPNPHGIAKTNKETSEQDELSYYEGDVIELLDKLDDHWYYACNVDNDFQEGLILAREMKIVKRLPGQDKVMEDGPCAVSTAAFEGRSSDELSFKEGELIMLISRIGDGEWLRGRTLKGNEGMFPKVFVEVVEDLPPDAVESPPPPAATEPDPDAPDGPYCVAIETFLGETPDDLSFLIGDVIEITERIDDSWLRGTTAGKSGMFPQVFVDIKVDTPVGVVVKSEVKEDEGDDDNVVTALFEYSSGQEGDLSFKEGDKIRLISRVNDEWVYGELGGQEGMFPSDFVDHIPENLPMKAVDEPKVEIEDKDTPTDVGGATSPTGECEALFDYESDSFGDLAFTAGERIVTIEWVNEEWMNGSIGERQGMFPLSFVKVIKELPKVFEQPKTLAEKKKADLDDLMPKARALRDFEPSSSQEMRVKTGDILILLSQEGSGWYNGENTRTGEFGNFPVNSVEVLVPLP